MGGQKQYCEWKHVESLNNAVKFYNTSCGTGGYRCIEAVKYPYCPYCRKTIKEI